MEIQVFLVSYPLITFISVFALNFELVKTTEKVTFFGFFFCFVKYSQNSEYTCVSKGLVSTSLGCENNLKKRLIELE